MVTPVVRIDGVDVTSDVIFADAEFTGKANGNVGTCSFRVRDLSHTYHTLKIGMEVTLDIDGVREWGGFITKLNRGYFFDARDCLCPQEVPLYYRVIGSDYNILLQRRVMWDIANPTNLRLEEFPAETPDQDIINYYTENYLDLSDFPIDLTSLVEHVGTPSSDQPISEGATGTWAQFMTFIAYNTGSIWYIDPDRKLVYTDVDTPNAPFGISDQPTTGEVGAQNMTLLFDGTRLLNDALVWGYGYGSADPVFARNEDAASIAEHGRWQRGRAIARIWKQETAQRTADTYVDGSPQSQRGGKIDRHSVECTIFTPGLRVAHKVEYRSAVFDHTEVIPVLVLRITFPTTTSVRYDVTLAHDIDEPQDLIDPPPPVVPGEQICTNIQCGTQTDVVDYTGVSVAHPTGTIAGYSNVVGGQWGDLSWYVYILVINFWQWTSDPDYYSADPNLDGIAYEIQKQYDDLYSYTSLPGQLVWGGEEAYQYKFSPAMSRTPGATEIDGVPITHWNGRATVTLTLSGNTWDRPRTAIRPLFPFTTWEAEDLSEPQIVSWGVFDPSLFPEWDGTLKPPMPGDDPMMSRMVGEKLVVSVNPGDSQTFTTGIGTFPASRPLAIWVALKNIQWEGDGGRVRVVASHGIEWFPVIPATIPVIDDDDEDGGCEPRCIQIGENCESMERIGRNSYRFFGEYATGSTRITINGVAQQQGVDYTESDPENGVIDFTDDIDPEASVYGCYLAVDLANQLPSWDAAAGTLAFPVTSGVISGYFGPQTDLWPSVNWHGTIYQHFHNGVDFAVGSGTPIYASADGVVTWEDQEAGGTMIHIHHGSPATPVPCRTTYAHLSARAVAPGAVVSQGDHIGYSGASGNVTGAHLHWGLTIYGWPEDPLPWTNVPPESLPSAPEPL
jgi:hypothetical protein